VKSNRRSSNHPDAVELGFSPFRIWRLFFAVGFLRPRSWMERRQLRFRALFFVVVGALLVLGVQAALGGFGLCPK
jgi:hypothetical protein